MIESSVGLIEVALIQKERYFKDIMVERSDGDIGINYEDFDELF